MTIRASNAQHKISIQQDCVVKLRIPAKACMPLELDLDLFLRVLKPQQFKYGMVLEEK